MKKSILRATTLSHVLAISFAFAPMQPMSGIKTAIFESAVEPVAKIETVTEVDAPEEVATSEAPPVLELKETEETQIPEMKEVEAETEEKEVLLSSSKENEETQEEKDEVVYYKRTPLTQEQIYFGGSKRFQTKAKEGDYQRRSKTEVKKSGNGAGNQGIFAPAVLLTKDIVGETELNKLRAKIITMHSDVIGKFTETAQTEFGNQVLKVLFDLADKDGDGTIDEEELTEALQALGFDFLDEKQIIGIFRRADGDKNGRLDFEEWQKAAPKTLKSNLIKLAKKNGHDLGFLA